MLPISLMKKINGHDALVFLGFLVVSFSLWLLKAMGEVHETGIVVDVVVKNLPTGIELDNNEDVKIEVLVRDKGEELFDYKFGQSPQVVVDFEELSDDGNGNLKMNLSALVNRVSNALKPSSTFLRFKDEFLALQLKREVVTLPVKLKYDIETVKHYELVGVETSAEEVRITLPSSKAKMLKRIDLPDLSLKGLSNDTMLYVPLPKDKYVNYEPSVVGVKVQVAPYVAGSVRGRVAVRNNMFSMDIGNFCYMPDSVVVSYMAPASVAAGVTSDDFVIELDFLELLGEKNDSVQFKLQSFPLGIDKDDVRLIPEFVRCRR